MEPGGRCPLTNRLIDRFEPGDLLDGKYAIERELAAGGMGVVYVARHLALARQVAVKVLRGEMGGDPEMASRFEQEARASSAIGHPNIIQVYDLGRTSGGLLYMVMELLSGQPLSAILEKEKRLPVPRALRLMDQALSALGAAHKNGIVHRDLKPDNIFVVDTEYQPDFVKLLDFGISKILGNRAPQLANRKETVLGTVMGTPEYMAPEQAAGAVDQVDARTDLYSLGVVLYELLCGETPFTGENYNAIMAQIIVGDHVRPRLVRSSIPEAVDHVVEKAMAVKRDDRWPSAQAMREALARALGQSPRGGQVLELETEDDEDSPPVQRPDPSLARTAPVADDYRPSAGPPPAAGGPPGLGALDRSSFSLATLDEATGAPPLAPTPPPAVARVVAAAAARAQGTPVPRKVADPFAAPDDSEVEQQLLLDTEMPARPTSAPVARPTPRPQPAQRRPVQPVYVKSGPSTGQKLAIAGLVLALVGGGVVAYQRFGGALPFSEPELSVAIETEPPAAELRIDGRPLAGGVASLVAGRHEIVAAAPGYVARRIELDVKTGTRVHLPLWRQFRDVDARDPAFLPPDGAATGSWKELDLELAKLQTVRECMSEISGKTLEARVRFVGAMAEKDGKPLATIDRTAHFGLDGAASCLDGVRELPPARPELDQAVAAYAADLRALAGQYQLDPTDAKKKAALVKQIAGTLAHLVLADEALRKLLVAGEWQAENALLALIQDETGTGVTWHVRRYLLAALVELRGGPAAAAQHDALVAYCTAPENRGRCVGLLDPAAAHAEKKTRASFNALVAAYNATTAD